MVLRVLLPATHVVFTQLYNAAAHLKHIFDTRVAVNGLPPSLNPLLFFIPPGPSSTPSTGLLTEYMTP
jgi:hypothetical protein